MNLDLLCGPLAVIGIATTTGGPPQIYQLALAHMTAGLTTGDPWTYYAQPDTAGSQVPARELPKLSQAPAWPELVERITQMIGTRPVVVYDRTAQRVLRSQLTDQAPARVICAWEIARNAWPGLYGDIPANRTSADPPPRCTGCARLSPRCWSTPAASAPRPAPRANQ